MQLAYHAQPEYWIVNPQVSGQAHQSVHLIGLDRVSVSFVYGPAWRDCWPHHPCLMIRMPFQTHLIGRLGGWLSSRMIQSRSFKVPSRCGVVFFVVCVVMFCIVARQCRQSVGHMISYSRSFGGKSKRIQQQPLPVHFGPAGGSGQNPVAHLADALPSISSPALPRPIDQFLTGRIQLITRLLLQALKFGT